MSNSVPELSDNASSTDLDSVRSDVVLSLALLCRKGIEKDCPKPTSSTAPVTAELFEGLRGIVTSSGCLAELETGSIWHTVDNSLTSLTNWARRVRSGFHKSCCERGSSKPARHSNDDLEGVAEGDASRLLPLHTGAVYDAVILRHIKALESLEAITPQDGEHETGSVPITAWLPNGRELLQSRCEELRKGVEGPRGGRPTDTVAVRSNTGENNQLSVEQSWAEPGDTFKLIAAISKLHMRNSHSSKPKHDGLTQHDLAQHCELARKGDKYLDDILTGALYEAQVASMATS